MKQTLKESNGTSFHDTVIRTSVNTLTKILGAPDFDSNDGDDKVNFEWVRETDTGDVFTVYDWKEGRSLNLNETIEFHIGGFSKRATEQALRELRNAIVKL